MSKLKSKPHRGSKPTSAKRRGYKKQALPPHGHHPSYPYVPVYYYHPYPYPPYQYHYGEPQYQTSTPGSTPPADDKRPETRHQQSSPPLLPSAVSSDTSTSSDSKAKTIDPPVQAGSSDSFSSKTETCISEDKGQAAGSIVPHDNDVLMGRGGKNNTHAGNENLREMARAMREIYIQSRKKHKTEMALQLVQKVFGLSPPGRFLQRNPVSMAWEEVDLEIARHKTSQCLRDAASEKPSAAKKKSSQNMEGGTHDFKEIARATTPVHSNQVHRVEPSPQRPQPTPESMRNRFGSWESGSGSLASGLAECWANNNGSFLRNRRGSMDSSGRSFSTIECLDIDANLILPEELDAVADGMDSFSLLDDGQLEAEMQIIWQPEMQDQSENPFDSDFF